MYIPACQRPDTHLTYMINIRPATGRVRAVEARRLPPEPQIVMFELGHAGIVKIRFNCAAKLADAAPASSTSAPDPLGGTP
jgi:hypothetical protein